jgi:putative PIN family toxin of toxin-antitoxin system
VFDPNVLVSGVISAHGAPASLVDLIDAGVVVPIVCPTLMGELRRVLHRPKFRRYVSPDQATTFFGEFAHSAEYHDDPAEPPSMSRDPDDDYLIALARTAQADALVSGDKDVTQLVLDDMPVQTPRELLDDLTALLEAGTVEE